MIPWKDSYARDEVTPATCLGCGADRPQKITVVSRGKHVHPRDPNYREIVRALSQRRPHGKLLDVGCHSGFFLRLAKRALLERRWRRAL